MCMCNVVETGFIIIIFSFFLKTMSFGPLFRIVQVNVGFD